MLKAAKVARWSGPRACLFRAYGFRGLGFGVSGFGGFKRVSALRV